MRAIRIRRQKKYQALQMLRGVAQCQRSQAYMVNGKVFYKKPGK